MTGLVRRYTKRGELMATFVLEDLRASIEVFVFPKVMAGDRGACSPTTPCSWCGAGSTPGTTRSSWCAWRRTAPSWPPTGWASSGSSCPSGSSPTRWSSGSRQLLSEHPGERARVPPRGPVGAAPAGRIQRRQPAGAPGRAAHAPRAERHRGLNGDARQAPPPAARGASRAVSSGPGVAASRILVGTPEPQEDLGRAIARAARRGVGAAGRARSRPCRLRSGPRTAQH